MTIFKQAGYAVAGCALMLSVASCGNNSSTTSGSDSTATTMSTSSASDHPATAAPMDTTAAAANANNAGSASAADPNTSFITDVSAANANEIMMLQAGADKGTDKMLKSDAKKMIADHKQLAEKLDAIAKKKSIQLPSSSTPMDMSDMDGKTGKDWDMAWVNKMVAGHQATIAKFESAQNTVTDADLKALIANTLPTLHMHLDMVTKLQSSMK